jgi:hypothetical protein
MSKIESQHLARKAYVYVRHRAARRPVVSPAQPG